MFFLKPKVRVRFAPSPTGFLHVGGLRTALYNYLFAKKHHGSFILRIEDTDRTRLVPGGTENIIKTLNSVGLKHDEGPYLSNGGIAEKGKYGPYTQSLRLGIYKHYAEKLLNEGKAYKCYCTPERLEELRNIQEANKLPTKYDRKCLNQPGVGSYVIRQKMPESGTTSFVDMVHGEIKTQNTVLEDHVLLKSDGFPTYNFANVVDDHEMKISHVIRGEEFISSTPKHILLYKALGWNIPKFAHLPLLLNSDRSKLSKRQGDVAAEDFLKKGYLSEALLNFIALLGWNPTDNREIFSIKELTSMFELEKINKSGAVFNLEKLDWLNGVYIRNLSRQELVEKATPFLIDAGKIEKNGRIWKIKKTGEALTSETLSKMIILEGERIRNFGELPEALDFFFADALLYDPNLLLWKKMDKNLCLDRLTGLKEFLTNLKEASFTAKELETQIKTWIKESGAPNGEVLSPMRVALTGRSASPPPFDVAAILGKVNTLKKLEEAIKKVKNL